MRHYQALVAESDAVGWPTRFETDLTKWDREALSERDPSLPFAWVLRPDGTGLILPSDLTPFAKSGASYVARAHADAFGIENCRFYWWDGVALRKVSLDALEDLLAVEYEGRTGKKV